MITKTMTIAEIIRKNPKSLEIFLKFGLGCAGCGLGSVETLEEGALAHGLSESEVEDLIKLLNSN